MRADMHVHTFFSDGSHPPEEIVREAKTRGVELLAVTDHDTVLGTERARAACRELGLKFVYALEISAYSKGLKLHTLGYRIDCGHHVFAAFCGRLYEGSAERSEDIVNKLKSCGIRLSLEDIAEAKADKGSPTHVMHIACAAAKKGFCGGDRFEFYRRYLAPGQPAYSDILRPGPEEAIEAINACGGFASLAHPGRIETGKEELYTLIKRLADAGLRGIECVYSTHTALETEYYKEIAAELSLIVTGGSDTHYIGGRRIIGMPEFHVGGELAELLNIEDQV